MTPSNIDTEMEESGEFLPAQEQQIEQQIYDQDLKTAKQTWKKKGLYLKHCLKTLKKMKNSLTHLSFLFTDR